MLDEKCSKKSIIKNDTNKLIERIAKINQKTILVNTF